MCAQFGSKSAHTMAAVAESQSIYALHHISKEKKITSKHLMHKSDVHLHAVIPHRSFSCWQQQNQSSLVTELLASLYVFSELVGNFTSHICTY